MLPWFIERPKSIVGVLAVTFVLAGVAVARLGGEFLQNFKERDSLMHWVEKPGTSIEAMRRTTVRVSKELRDIPGVRNFGAHIGRAEVADEIYGPNFTELWISIDENADYDSTIARIQEVVEGYPGLRRESFGVALALRGAEERLSPILMTALTAGFALLPLAVAGDVPGHEIECPMALVILGGLMTSTTLNLFFLPGLYLAIGRGTAHSVVVQRL